ncbi:MAG: UDP-N-acetylmuramoyl-tripeptide--D-alanyl-D-alanine ligase [Pseudomonadota bacterium]
MSAPLWTHAEIETATGGRATAPFAAKGVAIDSRELAQGDLFVALADVRDGHDYVKAAFDAGAAGALATHRPAGAAEGAPLVIVPDVLKALEALGAAARARANARIVAVTGSVGKTTAKDMLRLALGAQGRTHAAERSFNNHWGVPLTLARMPRDAEFAAIEIGMNHADEIRPLVKLTRPHAAMITTVASVHLENFRNEAGIAFAKAEILEGLEPEGAAILPRDNAHYARLRRRAKKLGVERILTFGEAPRVDARLLAHQVAPQGTVCTGRLAGRRMHWKLAAPGRHMAMNSLAALLAVEAIGADVAQAAMALGAFRAPAGRGEPWRIALGEDGEDGAILFLDESYNANPTSVGAAFEVLAATRPEDGIGRVARGRRIAMLGDMLELGPEAEAMHAGLAGHPALASLDAVHTCGPLMRALHEALPVNKRGRWFEDSAALAAQVRRLLDAGDAVMVKGSLGARMAPVAQAIKTMGAAAPARPTAETDEDA